ncbi:MAG: hypothetical protein CM15mP74_24540 [Halieaceae bacterium]|nr:MAG: hypothetical protein CM15mP74_24540 [Halieaceae bacterium]
MSKLPREAVAAHLDGPKSSPYRHCKTIARRLTEAKQTIPHFYLTAEYELTVCLVHRAALNESGDVKVQSTISLCGAWDRR